MAREPWDIVSAFAEQIARDNRAREEDARRLQMFPLEQLAAIDRLKQAAQIETEHLLPRQTILDRFDEKKQARASGHRIEEDAARTEGNVAEARKKKENEIKFFNDPANKTFYDYQRGKNRTQAPEGWEGFVDTDKLGDKPNLGPGIEVSPYPIPTPNGDLKYGWRRTAPATPRQDQPTSKDPSSTRKTEDKPTEYKDPPSRQETPIKPTGPSLSERLGNLIPKGQSPVLNTEALAPVVDAVKSGVIDPIVAGQVPDSQVPVEAAPQGPAPGVVAPQTRALTTPSELLKNLRSNTPTTGDEFREKARKGIGIPERNRSSSLEDGTVQPASYTPGNMPRNLGLVEETYDSARKAGFPDVAARVMVGEVGRENSFNPDLMFGFHSDPHNKARNAGIFSWQKDRADAVMSVLDREGLVKDGRPIPAKATLDVMMEFAANEMKQNHPLVYSIMTDPNVTPQRAKKAMAAYLKWRANDPDYAHHHQHRDNWIERANQRIDPILRGERRASVQAVPTDDPDVFDVLLA